SNGGKEKGRLKNRPFHSDGKQGINQGYLLYE
ncbi:MAG: hypothetical protein RL082_769, partial [Pseudomonadota bacterium]